MQVYTRVNKYSEMPTLIIILSHVKRLLKGFVLPSIPPIMKILITFFYRRDNLHCLDLIINAFVAGIRTLKSGLIKVTY